METTPARQDHVALELLSRAHSPETAVSLFQEKVVNKPLLLRPTTNEDGPNNARAARQQKRAGKEAARRKSKKPKPLSAKQKRALSIYDVSKQEQKYAIYEPLHRMWLGYIKEILGLDTGASRVYSGYVIPKSAGPILTSADYHGALLEVVRCRSVSRVGLSGIVVKDTKFTFEVITVRNELKIIPKEHTIFRFEIPLADDVQHAEDPPKNHNKQQEKKLTFELHGTAFESRAPERATKRVKLHLPSDP